MKRTKGRQFTGGALGAVALAARWMLRPDLRGRVAVPRPEPVR